MQASNCTCHLGCCLDHGTAPPPSAPEAEPRPAPPWPAWVDLVVREHERLVRSDSKDAMLLAALHTHTWPDGLRECQCMTGETEGPDGRWRTCSACEGWIYLWDAPEGAESEAA